MSKDKHEHLKDTMRDIGSMLTKAMPDNAGFALFVFDFNKGDKPGFITYTSNADRQGMIKTIREWLSHVED